ncbi:GDPmannose 4,6-dehydratase [Stella humosa]|uniref:GDP-mannose 4,6-dehydratase n=1 Tax=Stella humosa TaxID=94 RepID=A0A3N1M310_9PROT|nr:GDP-mannose 4,6-dehydratase [Stella humosa]ROQ00102.1 GDPmannose 4,6-dehydratase [Stella humosa]BBK30663.1 GDP-mannose 4,6-dehydratase [Stella humosa]
MPSVCLIFGATGQDGRLLARRFARDGFRVIGVSRRPAAEMAVGLGDYAADFERLIGDFAITAPATDALVRAVAPAVIVNVAGLSSVGASFRHPMETLLDNGQLNLFILETLRVARLPARYIFASSGELFGETPPGGADTASLYAPKSPYAVSKASASMILRNYREVFAVNAALAYLFPHESPLRSPDFVLPKIARSLLDLKAGRISELRFGPLDVVRDWGWAEEYMDAIFRQAQLPQPVDLILASGTGTSLRAMVQHGMRKLGLEGHGPLQVDPTLVRPADLARSVGNPAATEQAIGWRATCSGTAVLERLIDLAAAG